MTITPDDIKKLKHMLGATESTRKRIWGYRNYYDAGPGSMESMERLVSAGLCKRGAVYAVGFTYHATVDGCKAAGLDPAAIKRAFED